MRIIKKYSPNFWKGRAGNQIEAVVLHIAEGEFEAVDSWFADPASQVSAHYCVGELEIHQYVNEEDTAWGCGAAKNPTWPLYNPKINTNRRVINIEHTGHFNEPWSDLKKHNSANLIANICFRRGIPVDRVHIAGHYELTSNKPNCPALDKSIIDELIGMVEVKLGALKDYH